MSADQRATTFVCDVGHVNDQPGPCSHIVQAFGRHIACGHATEPDAPPLLEAAKDVLVTFVDIVPGSKALTNLHRAVYGE